MRYVIIVVMLVLGSCSKRSTFAQIDDDAVVVDIAQMPFLLEQCSRDVPEAPDFYRIPDESEVQLVESILPAIIEKEVGPGSRLSNYKRQYGAYSRNNRSYVYVNALTMHDDLDESWRDRVIIFCDGGSLFFGVEVASDGEVTHVAVNGSF